MIAARGDRPPISIVVGAGEGLESAKRCLDSLDEQARRAGGELIVVCPDSPDDLVPQLWGRGLDRATGEIVALTWGRCVPTDDWVERVLNIAGARPEYAAFGGTVDGPVRGKALDWAVFFARYSAFMPPLSGGPAAEIAGDNAAYRREAVLGAWDDRSAGFWETSVHRRLLAQGERLFLDPEMRVWVGSVGGGWRFARSRFRHGRHFGSTRPLSSGLERWLRVSATPAVTPVILLRIAGRVMRRRPRLLSRLLLASPWLLVFVLAWSAGEAVGYVTNRRRSSVTPVGDESSA